MTGVSAILLAAGRSRRMGAFKPLLPFGKQTVIESAIANLRAASVSEIVVVVGWRGDELEKKLTAPDVFFAINSNPDSPMATSIRTGMYFVGEASAAVLITPADLPAIPAGTIKSIIEAWQSGALLVQPEYDGSGGHPVLVARRYFKELLHLDSESGLRGFFAGHHTDTLRLVVDSPFIARDLDTWEDYVSLHQDVFGEPPPPG